MAVLVGRANKPRWGHWNCEEIGAGSPLVRALLRLHRSVVCPTKPPCYAGWEHVWAISTASCYCKFGVIQAFFVDKKGGESNCYLFWASAHFNRFFETSSSAHETASNQTMQNIVMATHQESIMSHFSLFSRNKFPINFKRLIGLKITLVKHIPRARLGVSLYVTLFSPGLSYLHGFARVTVNLGLVITAVLFDEKVSRSASDLPWSHMQWPKELKLSSWSLPRAINWRRHLHKPRVTYNGEKKIKSAKSRTYDFI